MSETRINSKNNLKNDKKQNLLSKFIMKKIFLFLIPAFILMACAGNEPADTQEVVTEDQIVEEQVEIDTALDGLVLNNGQKWKVDSNTFNGMNNVKTLVDEFDGLKIKKLGKSVKKELKAIIDACTMVGEDHNQYHIILHAMLEECKAIKKEKSLDANKLIYYLEAYEAHFEL
jgi:hypothetical protein